MQREITSDIRNMQEETKTGDFPLILVNPLLAKLIIPHITYSLQFIRIYSFKLKN
jgi:hypothetical protein